MTRITKDWITTYFDHGIDYQNRRLFLIDDIYESSARALIQGLKLLEKANADPIEIYVGTPGGDMYGMFGLYDAIRDSKCHVTTIAVGHVMSAGPLVLTAGDERVSYRNTWFMMHETWWSSFGEKLADHKANVKHVEQIQGRWAELLEDRTGTPAKKWLNMARGPDYYFDAPEAQEIGLIQKIVTD